MSWSVDVIGKPVDVNAAIQADKNIPQPLKDAVALFVAAGGEKANVPTRALRVQSNGHYSAADAWSNVSSFAINQVTLAPPAT